MHGRAGTPGEDDSLKAPGGFGRYRRGRVAASYAAPGHPGALRTTDATCCGTSQT